METNTRTYSLIKGIRVGLVAFLICFAIAGIVSGVINYNFIDEINILLNGTLSESPQPSLASLLLILSTMLNLTVFNSGTALENGGNMHIGLLIFIALPVIAFFIADRKSNKTMHFNFNDMIEYFGGAIVFALLLYVFSWIAKGPLLGLDINFTKFMNVVMTTFILMIVQLFIGINYNKNFNQGIDQTRHVLRIFLGVGLIVGVIGLLAVFVKFIGNAIVSVVGLILLLPNIAVYIMFTFMGTSIEFGEDLQKVMAQIGVDISFATLPFGLRIGFIIIFFGLIIYSVYKINANGFLKNLLYFALSFSTISYMLAYSTGMNLGFVKNFLDVQFGINTVFAFVAPMTIVLLAGCLVYLLRFLGKEIRSKERD